MEQERAGGFVEGSGRVGSWKLLLCCLTPGAAGPPRTWHPHLPLEMSVGAGAPVETSPDCLAHAVPSPVQPSAPLETVVPYDVAVEGLAPINQSSPAATSPPSGGPLGQAPAAPAAAAQPAADAAATPAALASAAPVGEETIRLALAAEQRQEAAAVQLKAQVTLAGGPASEVLPTGGPAGEAVPATGAVVAAGPAAGPPKSCPATPLEALRQG